MVVSLVLCLMIAVTCTRGIHQHSGVKRVLYSLLLTVNNVLMCKADFCGCVVPLPGLLRVVRRLFCCTESVNFVISCHALTYTDSYHECGCIKWKISLVVEQ